MKKLNRARRYALQALYSWQISQSEPDEIIQQYSAERNATKFTTDYFNFLVRTIVSDYVAIDEQLAAYTSQDLAAIPPIELNILRIGWVEICKVQEQSSAYIIQANVELAQTFGAANSYRMIHAVLNKIALSKSQNCKLNVEQNSQ